MIFQEIPNDLEHGGTGANNAADARENLGVKKCGEYNILPISMGGTGATTAENARKALKAAPNGYASLYNYSGSLTVPVYSGTPANVNLINITTNDNFTISNGGIKIGKNISRIKIHFECLVGTSVSGYAGWVGVTIHKNNGNELKRGIDCVVSGSSGCIDLLIDLDVSENDVITFKTNAINGGVFNISSMYCFVEVLER